jgi:hypothetical protein
MDNVNPMAMNLTKQVQLRAEVTNNVAEVDVHGEILELKEMVNGMTESLSMFADEVRSRSQSELRIVGDLMLLYARHFGGATELFQPYSTGGKPLWYVRAYMLVCLAAVLNSVSSQSRAGKDS